MTIAMTVTDADILDLTYLMDAAAGDQDFISEILGEYIAEMNEHLREALDLYRATPQSPDRHASILRLAHTIKGASANVGAHRVSETATKLETQLRRGRLEGGEVLLSVLKQEVERVRELIAKRGVSALLAACA